MINKNNKLSQFGKNIAKYRKAKKLTQNKLAENLDISREHLAKIETAKRGISINLLFKISETLEVSEKELFDFEQVINLIVDFFVLAYNNVSINKGKNLYFKIVNTVGYSAEKND